MKLLKMTISATIALAIMLSVFVFPQLSVSADRNTMRDITAWELISEFNIGISIGDSLDSVGSSETDWGNPKVSQVLINSIKSAGFNTIRLPVTWRKHIDAQGNPNTAWLDRVQEVVNMIVDNGLYCILNTHHEQDWLNTNVENATTTRDRFNVLWTAIANRFKDYGDHLLFEGFNEILKAESDWSTPSQMDYDIANNLAQNFVTTVRSTGGNNASRILICSTYGAIHNESAASAFRLPTDTVENKLAVEFHSYFPQQFCFSWGTQSTWGSESDINAVNDFCKTFYSHFTSEQIPVILGEFGAVSKNNTDARAAYCRKVVSTAKKYDIKCIYWDNGNTNNSSGDTYGIFDRSDGSIAVPEIVDALVNPSGSSAATSTTVVEPSTSITTTTTTTTTTSTTTTSTTTAKPILYGDTNLDGKINGKDSFALKEFLANRRYDTFSQESADVNLDTKINGKDSLTLKMFNSGQISTLPYTGVLGA